MKVYGLDTIQTLVQSDGYIFKMVANEIGVILFPHTTEHREMHQPGINYADDNAGNALAAMVKPGLIEFRHHCSFSDERVRRIANGILTHSDLAFASSFAVTYQGRTLIDGN